MKPKNQAHRCFVYLVYRVSHVLVDLGWVDVDLGSSPGWWAATVATYCQSRMVEHPKSKSTQPSCQTTSPTLYSTTRVTLYLRNSWDILLTHLDVELDVLEPDSHEPGVHLEDAVLALLRHELEQHVLQLEWLQDI